MVGASCPRCANTIALHEGRPFVSPSGGVQLWHPACWERRDEPVVVDVPSAVHAVSRSPRRRWLVAGCVTIAALATGAWTRHLDSGGALAAIQSEIAEAPLVQASTTSREVTPPPLDERELYPVPVVDELPLDELYPSLLDWIHPVTGADATNKLPDSSTARFGATRVGRFRAECGAGHCGVDLDGPIGRPIVAVTDGVVVRVERSAEGRDGRSGRYVRIEHSDGTLTSYMHLDEIIDGLQVGDRVDGGQQIGTLGATAIRVAAPHLHFSLEVPNSHDRGDHTNTTYVDPVPFLIRATVHDIAERRHPTKPAF